MNTFGKLVVGTIWVAGTVYIVCNCVKSKATLESAKRVYEDAVEYDNYSRNLVDKLSDIIRERANDEDKNKALAQALKIVINSVYGYTTQNR